MKFKDYYETLGVARNATEADIKSAYRKLARKYHPDVNKEKDAEERFKEVGEAYAVLKDTEKRAAYDQMGSNWKSGQDFTPPPNWNEGFEYSDGGFGGGAYEGDQSEFFESLFGRGKHRQGARGSHARQDQGFWMRSHLYVDIGRQKKSTTVCSWDYRLSTLAHLWLWVPRIL